MTDELFEFLDDTDSARQSIRVTETSTERFIKLLVVDDDEECI